MPDKPPDKPLPQLADDVFEAVVKAKVKEQREAPTGAAASPSPDEDQIRAQYARSVKPVFEPFIQLPDPATLAGPISDLTNAMHGICTNATLPLKGQPPVQENRDFGGAMRSAEQDIGGWTGAAARGFRVGFLNRLPGVAGNHFMVLTAARGILLAQRSVWEKARQDVSGLAKNVIDVLDHLGMCSKSELTFGLAVVGAIASAGSTLVATAGVAATTFAVLGVANSTAGAIQNAGSGATVDKVLASMKSSADQIVGEVRKKEHDISQNAQQIAQALSMAPKNFSLPHPALDDLSDGQLTGDQGFGKAV